MVGPTTSMHVHLKFVNSAYRDELTVTDGIVFKGENIVVPPSMRPEMLQRIHMGHMGIEKSKQRARDVLFWPGMSKQIEDLVRRGSRIFEGGGVQARIQDFSQAPPPLGHCPRDVIRPQKI